MSVEEQRDRLRLAKIAHLEGLIADIDRDLTKVPRLGYLSVLAIPFAIYMGHFAWAFVGVVAVICLIGTVYYILGVRRDEYSHECDEMRREMSRGGKSPA